MTTTVERETDAAQPASMTHREVLTAMSGLMLAMFVAMLSGTVVANALPRIIAELGGNQSQYTWVVTATMLAATATTPIWGKLSDRISKKLLIQLSITVFVLGSALAGFSQSTGTLIAWRVLQGVGMGGLQALVQIAMASITSPRERGRYMGYFGAVMAVATVGGPLLGGFLVDSELLGWRWCFWVGVPVAVAALITLQKTLHIPVIPQAKATIDWLGAMLIPGGVSILLVWVTLAGNAFGWISWTSAALVVLSLALIVAAVMVERRAADPIVPPRLIRRRTVILSIIASVSVGTAMFGAAVFFGQYFQLARGYSPAEAGLLTLPMIGGTMIATTVIGRLVTRTGRVKVFLVTGASLMVAGLGLLATIDHATPIPLIGVYMAFLGFGVGMCMQNLVLAVQNDVAYSELGTATSTVTFFRTLGGAAGVSVLGAILAARVSSLVADGLSGIPGMENVTQSGGSTSLDMASLPPDVREIVAQAYGDGVPVAFQIGAVMAVIALVAVTLLKEAPLRTTIGTPDTDAGSEAGIDAGAEAGTEDGAEAGHETSDEQDADGEDDRSSGGRVSTAA